MPVAIKNVLVLTYWPFKSGLVQAYTLPYLKMIAGHLAPGGNLYFVTHEPSGGNHEGFREDVGRALAGMPIVWMPVPYRRFGLGALISAAVGIFSLLRLCRREAVGRIHCFCTPAGAIGWVLSALTGIPLVLDSFEPHAEAMVENGTWKRSGIAFRLLFFLERLQTRRAAAIIAVSEGMRSYALSRYRVRVRDFYVKPACVDLDAFARNGQETASLARHLGLEGKRVCVYAGKLGGIYLDSEVFTLLKAAQDRWGPTFRALFLTGESPERLRHLSRDSGFDAAALVALSVEHHEVPRYLALADFALTPVRSVPTKRLCAPIKNGEYWAMGLPVIITPDIGDDSGIISDNKIGVVLRGTSRSDCDEAIAMMDALLKSEPVEDLRRRIREVAIKTRNLDIARAVYRSVY